MRTLIPALFLAACGGTASHAPDLALPDFAIDKSANCAASFGEDLTDGFGRFDGTVRAIVPPGDMACADPNSTHLVIQLDANDKTYRMVLDVISDDGSANGYLTTQAPLAGDAYAPGWHLNQPLDYVTTLAVHRPSFVVTPEAQLVAAVTDQLTIGAPLSVYATSMTEHDSAHDIHRYQSGQDGAIVLDPQGSPTYLLFTFQSYTF